jgi:hypothetical protein
VRRATRAAGRYALPALRAAAAAAPAAAQVGHRPSASPYRDIPRGHSLTLTAARLAGSGGQFGIGPHDGAVFGARYDLGIGRTISFAAGAARGEVDRLIVDPFVRLAERTTGPVSQTLTVAEVHVQFNVTGGKTWHRLAPFLGAAGGLAIAGDTPADTSGFDFGRRFYVAPYVGLRAFLSSRLLLRAEGRVAFWQLRYPATFRQEPPAEPGTPEQPNAVLPESEGGLSQWTTTPWLQVGLGYAFSP